MEKVFLSEIDSLDNSEGCIATNYYFSNFFDITSSRVTQILASLKEKGLIEVVVDNYAVNNKKRIIKVTRPHERINVKNIEKSDKHSIRQKILNDSDFNISIMNSGLPSQYSDWWKEQFILMLESDAATDWSEVPMNKVRARALKYFRSVFASGNYKPKESKDKPQGFDFEAFKNKYGQ